MKKKLQLFTLLVFSVSSTLLAQNSFFDLSAHFYYNSFFSEEIWPVKVDSLVEINGDQTFYFNEGLVSVWGDGCLDTAGPSIVGPKITFLANGNYLFYNRFGDSIPIYMDAQVGDSWICFQDSNLTVNAEVESIADEIYDGYMDEVHKFRFSVTGNDLRSKSVDNHYIKIGVASGVIRNLSWVSFPFIHNRLNITDRLPSSEFSDSVYPEFDELFNLSKADLFNFQIGDEYHIQYKEWRGNPFVYDRVLTKLEVIDRVDEADQLKIIYSRMKQVGVDSTYIDPDSNPHFFQIYNDVVNDTVEGIYSKIPNPLYGNPMVYSNYGVNVMKKKYNNISFVPDYLMIYPIFDSCARYDDLFYPAENHYVLGLGGPYYSYHDNSKSIVTKQRKIRYYNTENSGIYGSPIEFVGLDNLNQSNDLRIYPNPVTDVVKFDSGTLQPDRVVVFDTRGRKVLDKELFNPASGSALKVSHLPQGLYVFVLYRAGQIRARQTFIKQ